jgi:hypothetical protein
MVGQASSLSIGDDGQDARPTGNLSPPHSQPMRLLRIAREKTRMMRFASLTPALSQWEREPLGVVAPYPLLLGAGHRVRVFVLRCQPFYELRDNL